MLLAENSAPAQSLEELYQLAREGNIQSSAPTKAELKCRIGASPATVWALLVNASAWPQWNHEIEEVTISTALAQGVRFRWKTGGTTIQSQVQLYEPQHRLAWTGTALTAKAIHVWELVPAPNNQTDVLMKESMIGFLIKQMFPSSKLVEVDKQWLERAQTCSRDAEAMTYWAGRAESCPSRGVVQTVGLVAPPIQSIHVQPRADADPASQRFHPAGQAAEKRS